MDENDIVTPMTIENLAEKMVRGFDHLAIMMANGFEEVKEDLRGEFLPRFDTLEHKVDALRSDVSGLVFDGRKLKGR